MSRTAAFAALILLAAAPAARAETWSVVKGDGACEATLQLNVRRAAPTPLIVRYDGAALVLAFPPPAAGALKEIVLDRKNFRPGARQTGPTLEVTADAGLEKALATSRRIRLIWTRGRPAEALLGGAAAGLEQLRDCAEAFRIARLQQLDQDEVAEVDVVDGAGDLRRQAALAEARRLYEEERLASLAAGLIVPREKTYVFDGMDPVTCSPTRDDFVCR